MGQCIDKQSVQGSNPCSRPLILPSSLTLQKKSKGSSVTHGCTKAPTQKSVAGRHCCLFLSSEEYLGHRAELLKYKVLEYQLLPRDWLYKVPVQTNFTGPKHTAVTELGLVYLQNCNRGRSGKAVPACVLTAVSHLGTGHCGAVTGGMLC